MLNEMMALAQENLNIEEKDKVSRESNCEVYKASIPYAKNADELKALQQEWHQREREIDSNERKNMEMKIDGTVKVAALVGLSYVAKEAVDKLTEKPVEKGAEKLLGSVCDFLFK